VSRALKALRAELEAAGLKPGTPEFEREERSRRVVMCKEMKSQSTCWDCNYFDHCDLIKGHLRDMYKVPGGT
jgi:hypothetical protein